MADRVVAVTGATGRLGRAVIIKLDEAGFRAIPWMRPEYDLDRPFSADPLLERDQPDLVIHAAAWTDVDGCARDPVSAMRRNGEAVGELAASCRVRRVPLVLVSTNEVFDGQRLNEVGYLESDTPHPINAYGHSKLEGEEAAKRAFHKSGSPLWVVRTSWLYGPPGADFPHKIVAAAGRLPTDAPLRVVSDEFGSPTFTTDLAQAMVGLIERHVPPGAYHITNSGHTSRAGWAAAVLTGTRMATPVLAISQAEFERASTPPRWGVLDLSKAAANGLTLRPWRDALDAYLPGLVRSR